MKGAKAYAKAHADELPRHVAAIEADAGAFRPTGYGLQHHDPAAERRSLKRLKSLVSLLKPLGSNYVAPGFSGADIRPMAPAGVPLLGHRTNLERYFDIHHTHADTIDKVNPADFRKNIATMAAMAWLLAELPIRVDAE